MRIVRRYLFRTIVLHTSLVLAVLLSLGIFVEVAGQLDDVGSGDYGIVQMTLYILLKLPGLAFTMFPMAVLLGSLLGLGSLATHSELIALRSAGVSTMRLAGSVLMTGIILAVIGGVLGEYVSPPLESYARQYRALAKHGQSGLASSRVAWIRDQNVILNLNPLNEDFQFGGVYLYKMGAPGELLGIGHADSAAVDDSDRWVLNNYSETLFSAKGVSTRQVRQSSQETSLSPDLLRMTVVRPRSLDGISLYRYIQYLNNNGLDAHRFEVVFWARIASAVAIAPMCVLALPFAFGRLRSSGTGARMMVGVIIGLAYFLFSRSLADGGQVYDLNAALVAWMPTILLTMAAVLALMRVR